MRVYNLPVRDFGSLPWTLGDWELGTDNDGRRTGQRVWVRDYGGPERVLAVDVRSYMGTAFSFSASLPRRSTVTGHAPDFELAVRRADYALDQLILAAFRDAEEAK